MSDRVVKVPFWKSVRFCGGWLAGSGNWVVQFANDKIKEIEGRIK